MTAEKKNDVQADDAPPTGPLPEKTSENVADGTMPEVTNGGRDPSRVPATPGQHTPNLQPNDEQEAGQKEVLEGVDRAADDLRRVAQSPSERPPESGE